MVNVVEDTEGENPEVFQGALLAPKLAITTRFLYQAFNGNAKEVANICKTINNMVVVQLCGKSKLLQPIYHSKSMVIATNLLNAFFDDVLSSMGIPSTQHEAIFKRLCEEIPHHVSNARSNNACGTIKGYIFKCFPLQDPMETISKQKYFALWKDVLENLAHENK